MSATYDPRMPKNTICLWFDSDAEAAAEFYAANMTIEADNKDLAMEQFDAQPAGRVVFGFDQGWYEREYNPATGALWRWAKSLVW